MSDDVTRDTSTGVERSETVLDVLVVDDDPEIAELVRIFLERADDGLAVTVATGAPAGLEKVREGEFDAVVSDYWMPAMDGLALIDRVADLDQALPGVLFSSDDSPAVVRAAREADVPYVKKRMRPARFDRLAREVRAAVRARQR